MESAISLCYSPLPIAPLRLPPGAIRAARDSRVHLRPSHGSLCLPNSSTRHPVARSFGRVNCMLDKFTMSSKNVGESDSKIVRGMTGVSVIMACVLGAFNFSSMMNPKCVMAYPWSPPNPPAKSVTMPTGTLPGGADALESFLETMNYKAPSSSLPKVNNNNLSEKDLNQLKLYVVDRIRSGKSLDGPVKELQTEYKKYKTDLPEVNLEMASIELLLLEGKYEDARRRLESLISSSLKSLGYDSSQLSEDEKIEKVTQEYPFAFLKGEIILYKAIIHTMLRNKDTAAKWWRAFAIILEEE